MPKESKGAMNMGQKRAMDEDMGQPRLSPPPKP